MNNQVLPAGSRVRVISYGSFRGLKGTIRAVDTIPGLETGEAFCFYLVELEGAHIKEPIWFACDEVELVDCPSSDDERDGAGIYSTAIGGIDQAIRHIRFLSTLPHKPGSEIVSYTEKSRRCPACGNMKLPNTNSSAQT